MTNQKDSKMDPTRQKHYKTYLANTVDLGLCYSCGQPSDGFRCRGCREIINAQRAAARAGKKSQSDWRTWIKPPREVKPLTREQIDDADKKLIRAQYLKEALKNGDCDLKALKKQYNNKIANHELIHAVHIAHDLVERHVLTNPGILINDEFFDLAYQVGDLLAELYQKIGQKL